MWPFFMFHSIGGSILTMILLNIDIIFNKVCDYERVTRGKYNHTLLCIRENVVGPSIGVQI